MNVLEHYKGMTILITGASSGLGEAFARQLAPYASQLILVARRIDRLDALRQDLITRHPQLQVTNHQVDLSRPAACETFSREMLSDAPPIDVLINNAGLGDIGRFQSADWERIESMLEVNIAALTTITHLIVCGMKKRGRGAILNVSSFSAILPIPRLAVYAATKAYVSSFSESLRMELRGTGVSVTAVCPGPVETEFGVVASRKGTKDLPVPGWIKIPADRVVADALLAVARDWARVFPGCRVRAFALWISLIPLPLLRRLVPLYVK